MKFLTNTLEIFGICLLRFRPIPRIWCIWLLAVNGACLIFIDRLEAQVVLAVTCLAVIFQALVYGRIGFTRILGTAHILWMPMFAWMATRADTIRTDPELAVWILVLFATNLVSFVIDLAEAARFVRGERAPHYHWKPSDASAGDNKSLHPNQLPGSITTN